MTGSDINRRQYLLGAVMLTTVSFAGCMGGETDDGSDANDAVGVNPEDDDSSEDTSTVGDDGDDAARIPEDLPTDPGDDDFVDRTGQSLVAIETRHGEDDEPTFVFDPPFVRVDQGTTIRWINADGVFHTVTSTPTLDRRTGGGDVFNATISAEGDMFEWDASNPGRQDYYCSPHAGFMFGAIEIS